MTFRWEHATYQALITDTQIIPPQYFGDFIVFYWSRDFTEPEARAAVEAESFQALAEAVEAVDSGGLRDFATTEPIGVDLSVMPWMPQRHT